MLLLENQEYTVAVGNSHGPSIAHNRVIIYDRNSKTVNTDPKWRF